MSDENTSTYYETWRDDPKLNGTNAKAESELPEPSSSAIRADDKKRLKWIDQRLGQLGIDVRQSKHHTQMRYYLELLREEIGMTERFLSEDGESPNDRTERP